MSEYVTPFLVFNLGAEMVFVISQRLNAQNVPHERATFVLNQIIGVLLSKELITDVVRPQTPYSHETVKNIMEDVAQSSIMRLDPTSMDKLWDLITMVFKWQATLSDDIIKITTRHLYELENYITNPEIVLQLNRVQNIIDNFKKMLSQPEKIKLRETILSWLKHFNVKVSLLLKMGLQNGDGTFVANNTNELTKRMLNNLGENIYRVTQNGRILEKPTADKGNEVDVMVDQILGEKRNGNESGNVLKLNLNQHYRTHRKSYAFQAIEIEQNDNRLEKLFDDMNMNDDVTETNFKEDLLNMIGTDV